MDIDKAAYEAGKNASKAKKIPKTKPPSGSQSVAFDLTADKEAGKALGRQKLQAFHEGLQEVLSDARSFMDVHYSRSSFELPAAPAVKALPSSEEIADSFMGLLYGYETIEVTQD